MNNNLKNISILYVEDNETDKFIFKNILTEEVKNLYIAINGEEGYEQFLKYKPDIVITDINMPILGGVGMIAKIRDIDKNVPIIATSAYDETEDFLELIKLRINGYFLKPLNKKEVLEMIESSAKMIFLEQKDKEHNAILQNILNAEKNMQIVTDFKNNIFANNIFLDFFKVKDIDSFNKSHTCILDILNEHKDYLHKTLLNNEYSNHVELGKAFYDLVKNTSETKKIVLILDMCFEPRTYHIDMTMVDKKNHLYLLSFTNITELIVEKNITKNKNASLEAANSALNNAVKSKGEFLANMSHEIRTPLNAILGLIGILRDKETNSQNKEYLEIIDASSKQLLNIIGDILDFSKIENDGLIIEKIDFDTRKEFKNTVYLFDTKSSKKNLLLSMTIDENVPKFLCSDLFRIKQILSNFISNAIKFTPEGKKITVRIRYDNKILLVEVEDEGIGISNDKQRSIFRPFSQEDSSTTRKYGGTGLGLAICLKLVKMLDGKLLLESEKGKGSKFSFSIPVEIGKEIKKETKILKSTTTLKGKILLVEDNETNQMFMKILLKKFGLSFEIASDGIEAVEMFKLKKYDLILMDENMPNMGGMEATKLILKFEEENKLKHTPIVALTANALSGDRSKFLEAGMDEYLSKPVNKEKLNKILMELL